MDLARVWASVVIVVTCAASISPLFPSLRGREGDSFPLSWYPMFAKERPEYERPTYVFGTTPKGDRVKVDVSYWSSGGFNQGRNELTTTVRAGAERIDAMCERIAAKVAERNKKPLRKVTEVSVAVGTYDRKAWFAGDEKPLRERIVTTCPVVR